MKLSQYSISIARIFKSGHDFLIDILFPIECLGCKAYGEWLCRKCLIKIGFNQTQVCPLCKIESPWGQYCPECKNGQSLDGILAAGGYRDPLLSALIKQMKYRFTREIADVLGKYLALFMRDLINRKNLSDKGIIMGSVWRTFEEMKNAPLFFDRSRALIVPVPLHKKRLRWRGYNQSEDIGIKIAESLGYEINTDIIRRKKYNKPQAQTARGKRQKNIAGCFEYYGERLSDKSVILIDDVATTGATLEECAKLLKKNGAKEVWGLVAAGS